MPHALSEFSSTFWKLIFHYVDPTHKTEAGFAVRAIPVCSKDSATAQRVRLGKACMRMQKLKLS